MTDDGPDTQRCVVWRYLRAEDSFDFWDELDPRELPRRVQVPAPSVRRISRGIALSELPNETLTHVVNTLYLHPEEHGGRVADAGSDDEAAVKDGLLDATQVTELMDELAGVARQLAASAIEDATARGGDPVKTVEAAGALADGDALRASGAFKDAVNKYKDALAKAGARWKQIVA